MNSDPIGCFAAVVAAIVCIGLFACGCSIGGCVITEHYQKQAIERGYAEHNAVTGEWQWKETKGQSDED